MRLHQVLTGAANVTEESVAVGHGNVSGYPFTVRLLIFKPSDFPWKKLMLCLMFSQTSKFLDEMKSTFHSF